MRTKLLACMFFFFWATTCFAQYVDIAWVRRYNGPGSGLDQARAVAVDEAGNVCVTGRSNAGGTNLDLATIKYDQDGTELWVKRYSLGINADEANAIAVDDSGNVYVTGFTDLGEYPYIYSDCVTIKYYSNGDTAWTRRYDGSLDDDVAQGIEVDASGNVYITGYSKGLSDADYITIKYGASGNQLWAKRFNGPVNGYDAARSVAVDDSGNVYVTGTSVGSSSYQDYLTIKYYTNGDTAWIRRYSGPGNYYDYASTIVVDDSGNVYVTGQSTGSGTNYDYATIKYKPNGDTAWVRRYNGTANNTDWARAIAVDASGNVYVTGLSYGTGTGEDYCTIKYKPNGDTAWVRRYNGPGNAGDDAHAMAVDDSGNVYVTGESFGSGANYDYVTIKYDPDGYTIWEKRYNGTANGHDHSYAMSLDGSGNVYVTGESFGVGTDYDYATIKYLAAPYRTDTLEYFVYSPVHLIVTAPNLDSIGVNFNTIPNAAYDTTTDKNNDGDKDDIVTIPNPLIGYYLVRVVADSGVNTGNYTEGIRIDGSNETIVVTAAAVPPPGQADTVVYHVMEYLRGDANCDGRKTVSDVIYLVNYLFKGGPPPNPLSRGDANCCKEDDGTCTMVKLSVSDVIYLVNYLFKGGPAPCS